MDKTAIIRRLKAHRAELEADGIKSLALFGSVARGEADANSDVDIAITLARRGVGLFKLAAMAGRLEDILETEVDLVTEGAITNPIMRRNFEQDRVFVF